MNILITSAGQQSFLVEAFQKALFGKGKVIVADINEKSKSFSVADKAYKVPAFTDSNYLEVLLDVCREKNVKLIFSLNVDELVLLEENRNWLNNEGIRLVGGPLDTIKMSLDKLKVADFCRQNNLPTIPTYLATDSQVFNLNFPIIVKPRFGKGSRGIKKFHHEKELMKFVKDMEIVDKKIEYVCQELMTGIEFGFDFINDFDRKYAGVLVRRKVAMKNGETEEAFTEDNKEWVEFSKIVSKKISHEGLIDVDAIIYKNKPYIMDINFRFGGGYVFSHLAGADVPRAYISWMKGHIAEKTWLKSEAGILNKRSNFQRDSILG